MLDFETPTYVTAKEAQHLQSQVNTDAMLNLGLFNHIDAKQMVMCMLLLLCNPHCKKCNCYLFETFQPSLFWVSTTLSF